MIARFAPMSDSTVRSIKSSRACTSTWSRDVIGNAVFLDQPAVELEFGIRGRGKADLDFLEPAFHQRVEQLEFLRDVHRHGQRLVAIAQIDAAPARRCVSVRLGHWRSGRSTGGKGRYFLDGFLSICFSCRALRPGSANGRKKTHCHLGSGFIK